MGFTLLEVLIVTVIAVSITAFSVPFFKKTQERNKSLAAQGMLADIGNALQALRSDYIGAGVNPNLVPEQRVQLIKSHTTSGTEYNAAKAATEIGDVNTSYTPYTLFAREYMQSVPFSSSGINSNYKGYKFFLCPAEGTSDNHCCKLTKVACMTKSSGCTLDADFPGAYVDQGGLVVQVDKSFPENDRKAICGIS